jgi:hypothetical protein
VRPLASRVAAAPDGRAVGLAVASVEATSQLSPRARALATSTCLCDWHNEKNTLINNKDICMLRLHPLIAVLSSHDLMQCRVADPVSAIKSVQIRLPGPGLRAWICKTKSSRSPLTTPKSSRLRTLDSAYLNVCVRAFD